MRLTRTPVVTVAVTTYDSEDYVETCLRRIAEQTFDRKRTEVLVIDDGSTGSTVDRAESILHEHRLRGRVLTQENSGSPATGRNRAIDEARGEYLYFVDVDDHLGPDALTAMLERGRAAEADIIVGRYVGVRRSVPKVMFNESLQRTNMLETPLIDSLNVLKMYRTAFARNLGYRFTPALRMAEDHPFALAALMQTDRVAVEADADCYFWVRHDDDQGKKKHLTGKVLPVDDFYAYFDEVFDVIDDCASRGVLFAAEARVRYWNRLLSFDVPVEMRRKRDAAGRQASIDRIRRIMVERDASAAAPGFGRKARAMHRALQLDDAPMIEAVARLL